MLPLRRLNPHDSETCFRCGFALSDRVAFKKEDEPQRLKAEVEEITRAEGGKVSR